MSLWLDVACTKVVPLLLMITTYYTFSYGLQMFEKQTHGGNGVQRLLQRMVQVEGKDQSAFDIFLVLYEDPQHDTFRFL